MFTHTLLFAAALMSTSFNASPVSCIDASVLNPDGGPPRINLADKSSGDITSADWGGIKTVGLHGCVPDARITALTVCIKDCTSTSLRAGATKAGFAVGTDATITSAMRTMIANLPAGTPFTVKVTVKDAKGKLWEVPDAQYVWKG